MRDVQAFARQYSGQAVRTLGELMRSEATPPGVRVRAAELGQGADLLETRVWEGLSDRVIVASYSASRSFRTAAI